MGTDVCVKEPEKERERGRGKKRKKEKRKEIQIKKNIQIAANIAREKSGYPSEEEAQCSKPHS